MVKLATGLLWALLNSRIAQVSDEGDGTENETPPDLESVPVVVETFLVLQ